MSSNANKLSDAGNKIAMFMVSELSTTVYGYRQFIEGAYETAIQNYGYSPAPEGKDIIVDYVINVLASS